MVASSGEDDEISVSASIDTDEHAGDDAVETLDVRAVDGEPFSRISAALENLQEGETLLLINSFEPEPLYAVLQRRGFDYETTQVSPEEWHVRIERAGAGDG